MPSLRRYSFYYIPYRVHHTVDGDHYYCVACCQQTQAEVVASTHFHPSLNCFRCGVYLDCSKRRLDHAGKAIRRHRRPKGTDELVMVAEGVEPVGELPWPR